MWTFAAGQGRSQIAGTIFAWTFLRDATGFALLWSRANTAQFDAANSACKDEKHERNFPVQSTAYGKCSSLSISLRSARHLEGRLANPKNPQF
jgi:hypothetical protein